MVHRAGQIGVGKSNPAKGRAAQDFARRRLAVRAEEESRLRTQVRVPPTVQNDSGDVASGVETRARKHRIKLLANLPLVVFEGCADHFGASSMPLIFG